LQRIEPAPVYSRVVSCAAYIKAPATQGFGFTVPLGNRVRLLAVKVWLNPNEWAAGDWVQFKIFQGTSEPQSFTEIQNWENILPILYQGNVWGWWVRYQTFKPYNWDMEQLFEGKELRFGVAVEVSPLVSVLWTLVSFQVSEG